MKKLLLVILSLTIISCSKISQSSLQGNWYVGNILTQEITSNTDTGWTVQEGLSVVFFTNEILTFSKTTIIPCPTSASTLIGYDDYPGYVPYTLSGSQLMIPELRYSYYRDEGNGNVSAGEVTYKALTFDVAMNNNQMELTGTFEDTDNLGNVKKRTNVRIELKKTNLTNEDR